MSRSRVEIRDLYDDVANDCNNDTYARVCRIEVVPRKLVEMIIAKCEEIDSRYTVEDDFTNSVYYSGRRQSAHELQEYTKALLKYFEEDDR